MRNTVLSAQPMVSAIRPSDQPLTVGAQHALTTLGRSESNTLTLHHEHDGGLVDSAVDGADLRLAGHLVAPDRVRA